MKKSLCAALLMNMIFSISAMENRKQISLERRNVQGSEEQFLKDLHTFCNLVYPNEKCWKDDQPLQELRDSLRSRMPLSGKNMFVINKDGFAPGLLREKLKNAITSTSSDTMFSLKMYLARGATEGSFVANDLQFIITDDEGNTIVSYPPVVE